VDSPAVLVDPRSATSAPRSAISHVTAQRPVPVATNRVASVASSVVDTAVASEDNRESRLAIHAMASVTFLEIVLKARNVTTVDSLAMSAVTAHPRPPASVSVTSASSQVTSRLSAQRLKL